MIHRNMRDICSLDLGKRLDYPITQQVIRPARSEPSVSESELGLVQHTYPANTSTRPYLEVQVEFEQNLPWLINRYCVRRTSECETELGGLFIGQVLTNETEPGLQGQRGILCR